MGEPHHSHAPRITTTGVGRVDRDPDLARANVSVEVTRETAAEARAVAAATAERVIAAVRAAGVASGDIRTASIDVNPAWDHRDGRSVRVGFTVSSRLGVLIRDLDAVGSVIDAALGAGATGLDGVAFELAEPAQAAAEARSMAVLDARERAVTIARAAGGEVGQLIEIAEGEPIGPGPRPMLRAMAASAADVATPVLPGRVEVVVSVVAAWELA